jgi:VanZ family protein
VARWAALAWSVMVVYASLIPWGGWHDGGVSPWAYLVAPWPRHLTAFDAAVNLLGYMPLGAALVVALYPRLRGRPAVIVATLLAAVLAALLEAIQTYLPGRVASNVDLAANSLGALAGAALAAPLASAVIDRGRVAQWRRRWFRDDDPIGLLLIGLWPLTQAYPTSMLFGIGRVAALLDRAGSVLTTLGVGGGGWQAPLLTDPSDFVLAEAATTTAGLLALGLGAAATMRRHAPRVALLSIVVAAGLGLKLLVYGLVFGPDQWLAWCTRGALGGLALGGFTLAAAIHAPARALPRLAALGCVALLLLVNLAPPNPYHEAWLQQWQPGQLRNLSAAADWFGVCWPFAFVAWAARRWFSAAGAAPST